VAADLSGPAVYSAFWGARMPRVCQRVTSPPNAAQATALIQCHMDHATRENLFLIQNIQIQMDGTHPLGRGGRHRRQHRQPLQSL
jgi:hypothetical protein